MMSAPAGTRWPPTSSSAELRRPKPQAGGYSRIASFSTIVVYASRSTSAAPGVRPLLHLRVVAEQVQRERQRDRRRVVAGEQEDQDLVADLGVLEPLVAVARGDQQADQVVAAVAVRAPRRDQLVADAADLRARRGGAAVGGSRPAVRRSQRAVRAGARVLAQQREHARD